MPHTHNITMNDLRCQGVPQIETCFGPSKDAGRDRGPQRSLFQPGSVEAFEAFESVKMEQKAKIELSTTLMPPFHKAIGLAKPILAFKNNMSNACCLEPFQGAPSSNRTTAESVGREHGRLQNIL